MPRFSFSYQLRRIGCAQASLLDRACSELPRNCLCYLRGLTIVIQKVRLGAYTHGIRYCARTPAYSLLGGSFPPSLSILTLIAYSDLGDRIFYW